ncbi:uncharacterized protein LOC122650570 [Telopea speciosissima]|uniref:uncharacterized protein LOC122650570 n=1 Tax=Telopea speciosissima TaxID=54955 RepID=UPI001CC4F0AE|nr:uncharacterized protein LOC122650570 [Telopea speciosissima]
MSDPNDEEWKEGSEDEVETSIDSSDGESDGDSEHSKSEESTLVSELAQIIMQFVPKKLEDKLRSDPDMKKETMKQLLKDKWQLEPHKMQYYRARVRAREWNEGSHAESYALLPKYGNKLLEKNAGSNYVIESKPRTVLLKEVRVFRHLFIYFEACKKGFLNGCRPFIGLDGCHLKGPYGGVLLAAISIDGNNGLFPVAFGVVESECKDSWIFFLQHLHDSIFTEMVLPITFMTDKPKGLSQAIAQIFLYANHRHCARHLYNNFKVKYHGALLKSHFWAAIRAYNPIQFQRSMNAMKSLNKEAHDWLMKNPVSVWSRHAFDHGIKSDHVTNNMIESFNQWTG